MHHQNKGNTKNHSSPRQHGKVKNMKKFKYYNRIILNTGISCGDCDKERIFLAHSNDIEEVVYNDDSYTSLYELDESGYMTRADDVLNEDEFDSLYEEYQECDKGKEVEMHENYHDDEPMPYVKANWTDYDHYLQLSSEHGINTELYDITDAEIIEGVCYDASGCIGQDYPNTEHQDFYKFVANDGREFYIRKTHPFFIDDTDYTFELISKEEFEEYDDGELYVENATSEEINSLLEDLSSYRSAIRDSDYITVNGDYPEADEHVEDAIKYGEWTEYFPYHYNFAEMAEKLYCIETDEDGNIIDGKLPSKIVALDMDGDSPDYTLICADKWM